MLRPDSPYILEVAEPEKIDDTSLVSIKELAEHLGRPIYLDLSNCNQLTNEDGLSGMLNLQRLHLSNCRKINSIDGLKGSEMLEILYLWNCERLPDVSALSSIETLFHLEVTGCKLLDDGEVNELAKNLDQVSTIVMDSGIVEY